MTSAVTIWTHALIALLFMAAAGQPGDAVGLPRRRFALALGSTALWALAVAGIGAGDLAARMTESARNIAWLVFMLALVRRRQGSRGWGPVLVHGVAIAVALVAAALALLASVVRDPQSADLLIETMVVFRMITAASALVLSRDLLAAAPGPAPGGVRLVSWAIAGLWALDLFAFSLRYAVPDAMPWLVAGRGAAMIPVGLLILAGVRRGGNWTLTPSRTVAVRSVAAVAVAAYAGLVVLATTLASQVWGEDARAVQAAIVLGATTALFTLLSTPWLRSWTRVMVAKHLFSHRYDYRAEWLRFAETLGRPGEEASSLSTRIVKAVAELTGSPKGLLLLADPAGLVPGTAWAWDGDDMPAGSADAAIAAHLSATGRIVEVDAVRADTAPPGEAAAMPQWMLDRVDAWALVPLFHADVLVGAILLARPVVDRPLDWEDLDLLRVAGRQAASYLAEERAHQALADARRFDEFNRRFAFILHDIKNLASQLSLVARNAERHADNPEFRADMIDTLRSSADQMTTLLARLSRQAMPRAEVPRATDVAAVAAGIAAERRAGHPVVFDSARPVWAAADRGRLEQVLRHLVQNAAEASPPAEPVMLSAFHEGACAVIEVVDRGCGMSPAFVRDHLFRPFASTKDGGFGIGAFEARQLVTAMGGRLEVASREGEGTRFRVFLPAVHDLEAAA